jgi:hypothetical protein
MSPKKAKRQLKSKKLAATKTLTTLPNHFPPNPCGKV